MELLNKNSEYFPQFYKYYIYQPKKEINVKNVKKRLSGTDRTTF